MLLHSLLLLAVLVAGYSYFTLLIADARTRLARLGLFCSVFTISMYLSPLADLVRGAGRQLVGLGGERSSAGTAQPRPSLTFASAGQDCPEQVDALPVLPPDHHHLPGLHQLDTLRPAAPRPLHHGGLGQQAAKGCSPIPSHPVLSLPRSIRLSGWHQADPRPASCVSHSKARD